uniref:Uncharacterized protein n=1 Tax=Panagrolaimus sp. ES5 TaxID=591445 RepID=A0AC34FMQ1_9BILA
MPCLPSTSKVTHVTKRLPVITKKIERKLEQQLKLPIDCRKQLFVSIPPVKPSTSNINISAQPSSSKKRNSIVFEATSFSKLAFDNDPSSPQVRDN